MFFFVTEGSFYCSNINQYKLSSSTNPTYLAFNLLNGRSRPSHATHQDRSRGSWGGGTSAWTSTAVLGSARTSSGATEGGHDTPGCYKFLQSHPKHIRFGDNLSFPIVIWHMRYHHGAQGMNLSIVWRTRDEFEHGLMGVGRKETASGRRRRHRESIWRKKTPALSARNWLRTNVFSRRLWFFQHVRLLTSLPEKTWQCL